MGTRQQGSYPMSNCCACRNMDGRQLYPTTEFIWLCKPKRFSWRMDMKDVNAEMALYECDAYDPVLGWGFSRPKYNESGAR